MGLIADMDEKDREKDPIYLMEYQVYEKLEKRFGSGSKRKSKV